MQAPALHPGHNESESACSHQQGSRCARLSLKNTALKHCKYWIDRQVAKLNKTHPPLGYQNFSHTTNFLRQPCFLSWAQSLSHVWPFATPWTAACQASLSITNSQNLLKLMSIEWWFHPTISSSISPFSSCLQSFPASGSFQMSQFFTSGGQSIGVSASASVLPMNIQDWLPLGFRFNLFVVQGTQESSPTPQFKSINSSALSFLYRTTLTSIDDYWKNHSFD